MTMTTDIKIGSKVYPFRLTVFCLDHVARSGGYKFHELEKFMNEEPLTAIKYLLHRGLNKAAHAADSGEVFSEDRIEDMIGMDGDMLNEIVTQIGEYMSQGMPKADTTTAAAKKKKIAKL